MLERATPLSIPLFGRAINNFLILGPPYEVGEFTVVKFLVFEFVESIEFCAFMNFL